MTSATEPKDNAQFDAVFLEHWQRVYRVLVRLVGNHDDAQDLALETFWQLYQHPPADDRVLNLGGWLYRVATNLGLNALRSRKRRMQYEFQAGRQHSERSAENDAIAAATADEERARARQVLSEMDARQAQLLLLRHSGLSYNELGVALNVSPHSIGTLLVRAEREFEKRYRQKG